LKPGDEVHVKWADGEVLTGKFVKEERGFLLIQDEAGRVHPCLLAHCVIQKIKK